MSQKAIATRILGRLSNFELNNESIDRQYKPYEDKQFGLLLGIYRNGNGSRVMFFERGIVIEGDKSTHLRYDEIEKISPPELTPGNYYEISIDKKDGNRIKVHIDGTIKSKITGRPAYDSFEISRFLMRASGF
jgi:hypothetical protein